MSQKIGFAVEEKVQAYLVAQGLRWIESNYRCRMGEIDLIMCDQQYLIFVEVRARRSNQFGGALASVTYQKRHKLMRTAQWYLMQKKLTAHAFVRFDIVSVEGNTQQMTWHQNAFGADD